MERLKKKDKLYYARILPQVGIYEVCDLVIRTVADTWFVGIDKHDKHAYLFHYSDINSILFFERNQALLKVLEAEKKSPILEFETNYEQY